MRLFLSSLVLLLLPILSHAAEAQPDVKVYFTCAPWDGAALGIEAKYPDHTLRITVWSKGYEELANGKASFTLDNKGNSEPGTGQAQSCTQQGDMPSCKQLENVRLELSAVFLKDDGAIEGEIIDNEGRHIPLKATLGKHGFCG